MTIYLERMILLTFNKELNDRMEKEIQKMTKFIEIVKRYDTYEGFLECPEPLAEFDGHVILCDQWDGVPKERQNGTYFDLVELYDFERRIQFEGLGKQTKEKERELKKECQKRDLDTEDANRIYLEDISFGKRHPFYLFTVKKGQEDVLLQKFLNRTQMDGVFPLSFPMKGFIKCIRPDFFESERILQSQGDWLH